MLLSFLHVFLVVYIAMAFALMLALLLRAHISVRDDVNSRFAKHQAKPKARCSGIRQKRARPG